MIFVLTFVLGILNFVDSSCTNNYSLITAICCATSCVQLISKELKNIRDETRRERKTIHNILEAYSNFAFISKSFWVRFV